MTEIEDILNEIDLNNPQEVVVPINLMEDSKTKEVSIPSVKTEDDLIELTLGKNEKVEQQADDAFQMFFDLISRNLDHSEASKNNMLEALKVKVELNKLVVEMAKIKKKNTDPKLGIMINTMSPMQAGINLEKIKEAL